MATFTSVLSSEHLKLRRTLAFWLSMAIPLAMVLLQFATVAARLDSWGLGNDGWGDYAQSQFIFWALLALPLYVTLETALVAGIEHNAGGWRHLYATDVPRGAFYIAKQALIAALVAVGTIVLTVGLVLTGRILHLLNPDLGLGAPIPWRDLARYTGAIIVAGSLMTAIATWVALRWQSFVVACAVGIVMTVSGVVIINSDWGQYYPWAFAGMVVSHLNQGDGVNVIPLLASLGGGLLWMLLGSWDVSRRDVL